MFDIKLYLIDGRLFSEGYERVVHGGRGDYIELTKEQIVVPLQKLPDEILGTEDFYYYWLVPVEGYQTKVYWLIKTVSYADYKVGYYYISPNDIKNYDEVRKADEIL